MIPGVVLALIADAVNATSLWVYIVVGGATIAGSTAAAVRWLKKQAVAEAKVKALVDADVLEKLRALENGQSELRDGQSELRKALRPNGLDSEELGDIAKRTENEVKKIKTKVGEIGESQAALRTQLDQHIGGADQKEAEIWRELDRKADAA